ncbi:MAG: glycosyltransferase family 4 protein [Patescibacteria group bacterium]|nr:glycosyltransferase family 4 protein [Patescibacteria group bacterium]
MKILYCVTKSNWGGAQRHVFDLALSMKTRGHEVIAAVGGDGILKNRLEEAGIFTHSISSLGRDVSATKDAGSFRELYSIIKHHQPDILHLHSPKAAGLGAVAGRLLGVKKIVYTIHGWAFNEPRPLLERTLIAVFSWLTMLLCHEIILISEKELDQTRHFPAVAGKLHRIYLGVRPPTFMSIDGAKQFFAQKIGMAFADFNKKNIVGTIAELHRNKGLLDLIQAAKIIKNTHPNSLFIVAGEGEERKKLELLIEQAELSDIFKLVGYTEHANEYLKAFSIFTLPSHKEGLPYTILEAGCASLPVVSTVVGGIPEIITDMKSGILVQPKKPGELAHAITFLLEHPDERRAYGNALREKVLKDFSLEKMIEETERVYQS